MAQRPLLSSGSNIWEKLIVDVIFGKSCDFSEVK